MACDSTKFVDQCLAPFEALTAGSTVDGRRAAWAVPVKAHKCTRMATLHKTERTGAAARGKLAVLQHDKQVLQKLVIAAQVRSFDMKEAGTSSTSAPASSSSQRRHEPPRQRGGDEHALRDHHPRSARSARGGGRRVRRLHRRQRLPADARQAQGRRHVQGLLAGSQPLGQLQPR